jgi:hypothetical protein
VAPLWSDTLPVELEGILRKIRTRKSYTVFIHKYKGIPYWIDFGAYETKHYFVLEVTRVVQDITDLLENIANGGPKKLTEALLTFTEVHKWITKGKCRHCGKQIVLQGDNYIGLFPDRYIGKKVRVTLDSTVNHTHYGYSPEIYPSSIEEVKE